MARVTVRTMCPMNCHPTLCGMLADVEDGHLLGVSGDPENPDSQGFLCIRGQASREIIGNRERLLHPLIRAGRPEANQRVELRSYLLIAGLRLADGTTLPGNVTMWLGNSTVEAGGWVLICTCAGSPLVTKMKNTNEPTLVMYWGQPTTLFDSPILVPILVHVDKIQLPPQ